MQGRILGIKKTSILTFVFVLSCAITIALSLLTIFLYKNYYLWFFIFCLSFGFFELIKGLLFKFDSAFYFGILLLSIGGVGLWTNLSGKTYFQSVSYILCFAMASYFTFALFNQKFQLYLSLLLYFACILWFLVKINILSWGIFLAIMLAIVLIFILIYSLVQRYLNKNTVKLKKE